MKFPFDSTALWWKFIRRTT